MTADPSPPRKSNNGLVVALLIIGSVLLVGFATCVGASIWFVNSEQGQKLVEMTQTWQNAPGTAEIRELGCQDALVLDMSQITGAMSALIPDEVEQEVADEAVVIVQCHQPDGSISCADVGAAYIAAAAPVTEILVQVHTGSELACQEQFDTAGNSLGAPGS